MSPTRSSFIASVLRRSPGRLAAVLAGGLFLALPAIAIAAPPGDGPQYADEIRLPNYGLVRGQVTELVPGKYVVLKKLSGETRRFEWSQIESIALADGTIVDKSGGSTAPVGTDPQPQPEPEPEPEPQPEPQPEPEPGFDVDSLDGGSEPTDGGTEPVDDNPSKSRPRVTITTKREGIKLSLLRMPGGGVGVKVPADAKSEAVCDIPCGSLVDRPTDAFFIAKDGKPMGKTFQLGTSASSYEIKVRPKSPAKLWSGVAMIPAALLVGIGIGIIPRLHNVPQQSVAGYAAGAALISLAGAGGGITLIMFGLGKVKVLPGAGG